MDSRHHDFDDLNAWFWLLESQSGLDISEEMIGKMKRIVARLEDEPTQEVTGENFIEVIRDMHAKLRAGSRALGDAIVMASGHLESGNYLAAQQVYRTFIASCTSPFYRDIALIQLENIEG
jgi:hypothetical protein